jgi:hypothetical protein
LRRTHSFSVFADSLISCRYTRYPGHPKTFVQSVSLIRRVYPDFQKIETLIYAGEVTDSCSEPYFQTLALLSLVPAYSKIEPREANSWIADAKSRLISLKDDDKRLELTTVLARTQLALGTDIETTRLMQDAFDLGESVFLLHLRQNPTHPSYSIAGYDELTDLTISGVKAEAVRAATIERIELVKNDTLRAVLLIAAARGISED